MPREVAGRVAPLSGGSDRRAVWCGPRRGPPGWRARHPGLCRVGHELCECQRVATPGVAAEPATLCPSSRRGFSAVPSRMEGRTPFARRSPDDRLPRRTKGGESATGGRTRKTIARDQGGDPSTAVGDMGGRPASIPSSRSLGRGVDGRHAFHPELMRPSSGRFHPAA